MVFRYDQYVMEVEDFEFLYRYLLQFFFFFFFDFVNHFDIKLFMKIK